MAANRSTVLVDVSGAANIAAVNALLAAAVAALPAGFLPEDVEPATLVFSGTPSNRRNLVQLICSQAPFQDWLAVTAATVLVLQVSGFATQAAAQAAIDAAVTAQVQELRTSKQFSMAIGGANVDVLCMVFTDGAPAVS